MNARDLTPQPTTTFAQPLVDRVVDGVLNPDISPDGTTAYVPAGVTQSGDIVHMFWEGASSYTDWFPVSAGTAGRELPFDIARSLIDENRSRQVTVQYEIERDGQRLPSAVLRFAVGTLRLLDTPDVPDAVDGVFDPTGVTGGVAVVVPAEADLEPGDDVTVHVDGPNSSNMIARAVPGSGAGQPLTILFPVEAFASNLNNDVEVYYVVRRFVDGRDDPSRVRTIYVGAVSLSLPAPRIREAIGDELDPLRAADRLTATVNYEGSQSSDEVRVNWTGNSEESNYQTPWIAIGGVPRDVPLDPTVLRFCLDQSVTVTYEVRRNGATLGVSDPLTLNVLALDASPGGPLPTPQLVDASGDELDLDAVLDGGVITVTPPWPLIAEGERFWLTLEGTDTNGNPHAYRQAVGVLVNAQHVEVGLTNRRVPASYFESLGRGTTLTLTFKVAFDGANNEAGAVTFPVQTYTIAGELILAENFETAPVGGIPIGSTLTLKSMSVKALTSGVGIHESGTTYAPMCVGRILLLRARDAVRIELPQTVRKVRFGIADSSKIVSVVRYLGRDMNLIHTHSTPSYGSGDRAWSEWTSSSANIKYIEITDGGGDSFIDNFTFEI